MTPDEEVLAFLEAIDDEEVEIDEEITEIAGGLSFAHAGYARPGDPHVTAFSKPLDADAEFDLQSFEADWESVPEMLDGLKEHLSALAGRSTIVGMAWFGIGPPLDAEGMIVRERLNSALWRVGADSYTVFYVDFDIDSDGMAVVGEIYCVSTKGESLLDANGLNEPADMLEEVIR